MTEWGIRSVARLLSLPWNIAARTAGDTVSTASNSSEDIPDVAVGYDRKLKPLQSDTRSDVPVERSMASMVIVSVYEEAVSWSGTFATTGTSGLSIAGGVTIADVLTCSPAAIGRLSKLFNLVVIADIDDCSARTTSTSDSISGLVSGMTRSVGGRKFQTGVVVTAGGGGCRWRAIVASRLQSAALPQRVDGPGVAKEVVARVVGGAGGGIARELEEVK